MPRSIAIVIYPGFQLLDTRGKAADARLLRHDHRLGRRNRAVEGRRPTTHWESTEHFGRRYSNVILDADRIYIRDGNIWTSAGVSAGIDLALALIEDDVGARGISPEPALRKREQRPPRQSNACVSKDARTAIETSRSSLEHIAEISGFGDPGRMRRSFVRAFGLPPQALRRTVKA